MINYGREINAPSEYSKASRLDILLNIAILDIDYFKQYNDTYGHQAGDACLVRIADILKNTFRRSNETVARYGGEEFVVMSLGDEDKELIERLEQLSDIVEDSKIEHLGSKVSDNITISGGIASTAYDECYSIEELIRTADSALYMAKGNGRNRVVVFRGSHNKCVKASI
jgi:diguanylate cyclase (GGDEF)-like protein